MSDQPSESLDASDRIPPGKEWFVALNEIHSTSQWRKHWMAAIERCDLEAFQYLSLDDRFVDVRELDYLSATILGEMARAGWVEALDWLLKSPEFRAVKRRSEQEGREGSRVISWLATDEGQWSMGYWACHSRQSGVLAWMIEEDDRRHQLLEAELKTYREGGVHAFSGGIGVAANDWKTSWIVSEALWREAWEKGHQEVLHQLAQALWTQPAYERERVVWRQKILSYRGGSVTAAHEPYWTVIEEGQRIMQEHDLLKMTQESIATHPTLKEDVMAPSKRL